MRLQHSVTFSIMFSTKCAISLQGRVKAWNMPFAGGRGFMVVWLVSIPTVARTDRVSLDRLILLVCALGNLEQLPVMKPSVYGRPIRGFMQHRWLKIVKGKGKQLVALLPQKVCYFSRLTFISFHAVFIISNETVGAYQTTL